VLTAAGLVDNLITTYSNVMNYAGPTVITNNGRLTLAGGDNRLSTNTNVVVHSGTFNLGGNSQTVTGLTGQGTVTNASGGVFTVNLADSNAFGGVIAGAGGLVKSGAGTLTLSGENTFSGGTTLDQGVLRLDHASAAGSGAITQTPNSSTLQINTTGTVANVMSIFNIQTLQTVTLSGNKTLNNATYTVEADTTTTESGNLSGAGGITKQGTGTLLVTGNNTFTGAVAVNEGVLELASTVGGAAGNTVSVSVATNAILLLSQSLQVNTNAAVSLSGGTIQRAGGVSQVFGSLNLGTGSFLDFGTGAAGNLTFGTYQNNETPSALLTLNNFLPGNSFTFSSASFTTNNIGSYFTFGAGYVGSSITNTGSTFTITAIPEPATYLAAAGLLSLLLLASSRPILRRRGAFSVAPTPPCRPVGLWPRSRG
jgi:fibronectin-binding autotransporter adhesin